MAPNKPAIIKWLEALRSGKYKQGTGCLKNIRDNTYCCLGVACEAYKELTGSGEWGNTSESIFHVEKCCSSIRLPETVANYFGFETTDPDLTLIDTGKLTCASVANDEYKLSFEQIADLIEKQYLTVE